MVGAVLSVLLGILPVAGRIPVVVPVIGLALGLNAIVKERRAATRKPLQRWLGLGGVVLGAVWVILLLVRIYGRPS